MTTTTDIPITGVTVPAGGRSDSVEPLPAGSLGEPRRITHWPVMPTDSFTQAGEPTPGPVSGQVGENFQSDDHNQLLGQDESKFGSSTGVRYLFWAKVN